MTEATQPQQQQLNNQNFYLGGEQSFAGLLWLSRTLLFYWAHTAFRTFFLGFFMIHCEVHWTCETCTDPPGLPLQDLLTLQKLNIDIDTLKNRNIRNGIENDLMPSEF